MFVVHDQLQNCWSTVPVSALGDLKAKICHHDKRPGLAPRLFFCSIFLLWISCNQSATAIVSAPPFFGLDRGPSRLRHCRLYKFGAHFNKPQTFFSWSNIIVPLCPLSYPRGTTKLTLGSYPILKLNFSSAQWLVCCKPLFGSIGSISRAQPCLHRLFRGNLNQSQQKLLKFESFKMVQTVLWHLVPFFGVWNLPSNISTHKAFLPLCTLIFVELAQLELYVMQSEFSWRTPGACMCEHWSILAMFKNPSQASS